MPELPTDADVVVIGGGVVGTSAAFHLAEAGAGRVVLVEADQLGAGSTTRSAGGFRLQFSDEVNVRLAQRSVDAFERFESRPGADIGLKQVGYLFLLDRPTDVEEFAAAVDLQRSLGVDSRMLTPDEAASVCSLAGLDGVLAASWCARDGHCDPASVVLGYAAGARAHGAVVSVANPVLGIDVDGGGVAVAHTAKGSIRTSAVVNAAGAWAPAIAAMVGIDLPVVPVQRPIWFTEPMPDRPARLPMTIDFTTGFYFHAEGPGLLFGMADPDQPPGFDAPMRPDWLEIVGEVAARRAPALLDVGIAGGWTGAYEVTPDHNAIVGGSAAVRGFFTATGFSGHGFQLGPAVGEILRDLVLGHTPAVDVSAFSAERFAAGTLRPERHVV